MKIIINKHSYTKKYTILFVSNDFNYFINNNGSFYRMYQNLAYFHNHKNYNVIVLQSDKEQEYENEDLKENIKIYYYKPLKLFRNYFNVFLDFNPSYIIKIIKILKKHKIDLLHYDYVYGINVLRFFTKKPISYNAYNVEFIYHKKVGSYYRKMPPFLRKIYIKYIYIIEKYALKLVKNINAFSLDDKREFIKIYKIPEEKIHINSMGYKKEIYYSPIMKKEARERFNIDIKKFVIIFHGFYFINVANKDAIDIIKNKIAPKIKDEEILFLIAGKIPKFKNTKNIRFIGYIDDLRYFLYAADIAIVPILRGSGIRIKMIDYLSARLPMITTNQGASGLIFEDNVHGFIIKKKNFIDEFIKKIKYLKNHPEIISRFKKNIKILLEKEYNWDLILNELEHKYAVLMGKDF